MRCVVALTVLSVLAGCGSLESSGCRVVEEEEMITVFLAENVPVNLRPADADYPLVFAMLIDGNLFILQWTQDGESPFAASLAGDAPAFIAVERVLEDGGMEGISFGADGIPRVRIKHSRDRTDSEVYLLDSIKWKPGP